METALGLIMLALLAFYWRWRWLRGSAPLGIHLLVIGWRRARFYCAWLLFRWKTRNDPPNSN